MLITSKIYIKKSLIRSFVFRQPRQLIDWHAFIAMGVALLARTAFLGSKPFWRDEAWVATLAGMPLREAIERHLPVPIGFVALTKLTAWLPGLPPEVSYRLLPLICGVAALPLLYQLAYRLSGSRLIAVNALWLAAGLPALIYYSRELKSYEIDFLFAVLVPLLTLRLFDRHGAVEKNGSGRPVTIISLLAALTAAPWLSFGSLFPIIAALTWGWLALWPRATRPTQCWWLLATLAYGAAFGAAYFVAVQAQVNFADDLHSWKRALFSLQGLPTGTEVTRAVSQYFRESLTYLFQSAWRAVVPFMLIGAWWWPGPQRSFLCWLCFGSAAAAIVAALADHYLLVQGRFLLFAAPPYLLFAAAGLVQVGRWLEPRLGSTASQRLGVGIVMFGALYGSGAAVLHRLKPSPKTSYFIYDVLQDVEPLIAHAASVMPTGEPVLISSSAGRPFRFYARGRLAAATVLREEEASQILASFRRWLTAVERHGWVLLVREPDEKLLRKPLEDAGFDYRQVSSARGTLLWKITRRQH